MHKHTDRLSGQNQDARMLGAARKLRWGCNTLIRMIKDLDPL